MQSPTLTLGESVNLSARWEFVQRRRRATDVAVSKQASTPEVAREIVTMTYENPLASGPESMTTLSGASFATHWDMQSRFDLHDWSRLTLPVATLHQASEVPQNGADELLALGAASLRLAAWCGTLLRFSLPYRFDISDGTLATLSSMDWGTGVAP